VFPQIINAVIVVDRPVRLHHVLRAQPVFHDENRLLVAVIEEVKRDPQPQSDDLRYGFFTPSKMLPVPFSPVTAGSVETALVE
jgi:hypothetical protein